MIQISVEFSAVSRVITGVSEFPLSLKKGATIGDVIASIGQKYPQLIGEIIEKDGKALIPTNVFSVNGKQILHETDMAFQPANRDTLILLSLLSGG